MLGWAVGAGWALVGVGLLGLALALTLALARARGRGVVWSWGRHVGTVPQAGADPSGAQAAAARAWPPGMATAAEDAAVHAANRAHPVHREIAAQLRRLAEARQARARTVPPVGAAPCVLVVDAAPVPRARLARVLERQGWQVRQADGWSQALAALHDGQAQLVIAEAGPAGHDGQALARAIRADAALAQLPVILLGDDDDQHRSQAARAGASVLLGRPHGEAALLSHIRRLCPRAPQRPALARTDATSVPALVSAATARRPCSPHAAEPA